MKVIMMAAGIGSRITRHINGKAKCTVEVGEETLIENSLQKLHDNGITDISIVLGYKKESIIEVAKKYDVKFYYNPFFDVTNSMASLWFAKDELKTDEDVMLMNADVFFEEKLLHDIVEYKEESVIYSDESRIEEADYKLYYENNVLQKYGKELTSEETTGEYIGIVKLLQSDLPLFREQLEEMINQQNHGLWWENALYQISEAHPVKVRPITGLFWAEVDYIEDYQRILNFLAPSA